MNEKKIYGFSAEQKVAQFLLDKGYEVLANNFSYKQLGEIDIICKKDSLIIFVEVKARKKKYTSINNLVNKTKQIKIISTAKMYLLQNNIHQSCYNLRFDIAYVQEGKEIDYYENAFSTSE